MVEWTRLLCVAEPVVARTLGALPPEVRARVREVAVFLEPVPGDEDLDNGAEEDMLGFFEGATASDDFSPSPPRLRLWLENIWLFAGEDWSEFRNEVRITLLHEIGHFLGWDEEDVAERGLE